MKVGNLSDNYKEVMSDTAKITFSKITGCEFTDEVTCEIDEESNSVTYYSNQTILTEHYNIDRDKPYKITFKSGKTLIELKQEEESMEFICKNFEKKDESVEIKLHFGKYRDYRNRIEKYGINFADMKVFNEDNTIKKNICMNDNHSLVIKDDDKNIFLRFLETEPLSLEYLSQANLIKQYNWACDLLDINSTKDVEKRLYNTLNEDQNKKIAKIGYDSEYSVKFLMNNSKTINERVCIHMARFFSNSEKISKYYQIDGRQYEVIAENQNDYNVYMSPKGKGNTNTGVILFKCDNDGVWTKKPGFTGSEHQERFVATEEGMHAEKMISTQLSHEGDEMFNRYAAYTNAAVKLDQAIVGGLNNPETINEIITKLDLQIEEGQLLNSNEEIIL